jgi:hypothetical protein
VKSGHIISIIAAVMLAGLVYSSSSTFLFVEGVIDGGVSCSPQDGGKTYCCASVLDKNGYTTTTYCTTCDDTNPPSNCTPREKPLVVNPGRHLSNILEATQTLPNLSQSVGPRGGVLQTENNLTFSQADISSNNDSNNTLALDQSDLVSDTVKKPTRTVENDGGERQDESQTTEEQSDEPVDQDKND